jgi:hypothetical protein
VRRRYGSIAIADDPEARSSGNAKAAGTGKAKGVQGGQTGAPEELRYYQYTLLAQQGEGVSSRGKKRKRAKQADDEGETYVFHVVPASKGDS